MKNKQYLFIGCFVLLGFISIIGILLWFSADSRKSYNTYQVVFHEPVDGLTTSSVVKYNGVEVGNVSAIVLDNKNPNNITVNLSILQSVSVTTSSYATMKSQGVTGMSYIALTADPKITSFTYIKPHNSEPYPQIPERTSFLTTLTEQAQKIGTNIEDISTEVKVLLNDENITHINHTLANIDKVTSAIADQSGSISDSLKIMTVVLNNVNSNSQSLNDTLLQVSSLVKALELNSTKFNGIMDSVQNDTLNNINNVLLPNINQSMLNMNNTSGQLSELIKTVNQNPSVFIRGKTNPPKGPGE
ncbi:MAG: MlaD family protein [Burkholderiales bacterium]|nr:MlaD family protein [Burkholderiales bacterium]